VKEIDQRVKVFLDQPIERDWPIRLNPDIVVSDEQLHCAWHDPWLWATSSTSAGKEGRCGGSAGSLAWP